ncbi:hypothetical protein MKMG_00620 [Methanogenium sp. MK-MG]|nr:hypothetical protein MKMG_00620 [Methanogenium sp. MK-MG]
MSDYFAGMCLRLCDSGKSENEETDVICTSKQAVKGLKRGIYPYLHGMINKETV